MLLTVTNLISCEEASSIKRSLDVVGIPNWRPLVQNPYQNSYYQSNPAAAPAHLITYAHLDPNNQNELFEAAKLNAQTLKKYTELSHQQPITSYSNPYPLFTQTPGPLAKIVTTTTFVNPAIVRQPIAAAASSLMHARLPYPGKSAPLYSTKLNYLGKPDFTHIGLHQNSIHQTIATTPKVAGFTKEHGGRVNYHYHHPSFAGLNPMYDTTTKRIPMFG
jgi:hypothetical protein